MVVLTPSRPPTWSRARVALAFHGSGCNRSVSPQHLQPSPRASQTVLPIVVLAFYLAGAAWLASGVYRAQGNAAQGRRASGLALGVIAVLTHAIVVWRSIVAMPDLAFSAAET